MSNRRAVNVTKGKQGFQETNRSETTLTIDPPRESLSTSLHGEDANDLRQDIDENMRRAINRANANPFGQSAHLNLVAAAQLRILSRDEDIAVADSWNKGGVNLVTKSLRTNLPFSDDYSPISAERREDMAEEMVSTGLNLYSRQNEHGQLSENDEFNRDARFRHAALVLGDRPEVAEEMGRICEQEIAELRDPRDLDSLSLYKQARVTVCRQVACKNDCDC